MRYQKINIGEVCRAAMHFQRLPWAAFLLKLKGRRTPPASYGQAVIP